MSSTMKPNTLPSTLPYGKLLPLLPPRLLNGMRPPPAGGAVLGTKTPGVPSLLELLPGGGAVTSCSAASTASVAVSV